MVTDFNVANRTNHEIKFLTTETCYMVCILSRLCIIVPCSIHGTFDQEFIILCILECNVNWQAFVLANRVNVRISWRYLSVDGAFMVTVYFNSKNMNTTCW